MSSDAELLCRYVEHRSEAAFAELVRRHLDLVYFTALRLVSGDAHRAQDVAQVVFSDLARKAASLTNRDTLAGWLHTSTRFAASNVRRIEFSRHHHEQEAAKMNAVFSENNQSVEWERLRPMVDDVIAGLDERDREAVLMRFFENQPFAKIGAALRLSEDAARMRVDRALEKLRAALARRGVKSTSAALAAIFANQLGATAPAGLGPSITTIALAGVATSGIGGMGAGLFMSKAAIIVTGLALVAMSTALVQWNHARAAETAAAALSSERDTARARFDAEQQRTARYAKDIAALQGKVDALQTQAALASAEPAKAASPAGSAATPKDLTLGLQRWEIQQQALINLRQIDAARRQIATDSGKRAGSINDLVRRGRYIKAVRTVGGEDYSTVSMNPDEPMTVRTPSGITVTFDPAGANTTRPEFPPEVQHVQDMGQQLQPSINKALGAFRAANNGRNPSNEQALVPFFPSAKEGADFVEYLEAKKAAGL